MTILKKPHYSDLALENRAIILGKLKPKDGEQFKDFIESYEKSTVCKKFYSLNFICHNFMFDVMFLKFCRGSKLKIHSEKYS